VSSLRGYSYDNDAYFNHNAELYTNVWSPPLTKKYNRTYIKFSDTNKKTTTKAKTEALIKVICKSSIDLTGSYNDWRNLASSLANEFGESGRDYFHQISQFHHEYNQTKTDTLFSNMLKKNYSIGIGTFFYHCKKVNIL